MPVYSCENGSIGLSSARFGLMRPPHSVVVGSVPRAGLHKSMDGGIVDYDKRVVL